VGLNSVKFRFVAEAFVVHGFPEPETGLYSRVAACQGIALLFKKGSKIRDIKGKRSLLFTCVFFLDFRKVFPEIFLFFLFFFKRHFSDINSLWYI
jgi:hypothetical protein